MATYFKELIMFKPALIVFFIKDIVKDTTVDNLSFIKSRGKLGRDHFQKLYPKFLLL